MWHKTQEEDAHSSSLPSGTQHDLIPPARTHHSHFPRHAPKCRSAASANNLPHAKARPRLPPATQSRAAIPTGSPPCSLFYSRHTTAAHLPHRRARRSILSPPHGAQSMPSTASPRAAAHLPHRRARRSILSPPRGAQHNRTPPRAYFSTFARYSSVTICARVHGASGANRPFPTPPAMPRSAAQATAFA